MLKETQLEPTPVNPAGSRKIPDRELKDKLAALPDRPGVYLFKDLKQQVIYVGKAKSLRNRVRSYFTGGDDGRHQYARLVSSIRDVEIILTRDEVEALRTEATIIQFHRPRFNVDLKDDKSYPYLQITREPFPRVQLTRKPRTRKADYYGPYTDVRSTRALLRNLRKILQIRECNLPLTPEKISKGKFKLCLDYHIHRCGGPCEGKVSEAEYKTGIDWFLQFLKGNHDHIISDLEREMRQHSSELRFEEAANVRDRLQAARKFTERQKKVDLVPVNQDAIGFVREDDFAAFSVLRVRGGRIVGHSPFYMKRAGNLDEPELVEAFITRHYNLVDQMPDEVFLSIEPPDVSSLSKYLTELAEHKVQILTPQRGEKHSLLNLAHVNAEQQMAEKRVMAEKRDFIPRSLKALQEHLKLTDPPLLIEAFDISNLQGLDSVASMVVFRDGKPYKSSYRIFKIKTVPGINDVASIGEAVSRRYSRLKDEIDQSNDNSEDTADSDDSNPNFPDLILIDGGKGQLARAREMLDNLGLHTLPVIGLAKRLEEIYIPGESEPISLPKSSSALRMLQQLRDEAHRFAITKHRLLRGKRQIKSRLDEIPGIGPARRQELLRIFGSVKRIAAASIDEIAAAKGMTRKLAVVVIEELNPQTKE